MPLLKSALPSIAVVVPIFILSANFACAATHVSPVPIPPELRSAAYTVTINGQPADVAHAAASYDYLNIEATGPIKLTITAAEPGFWDHGVDIQPWRLGIRPKRIGNTIQFELKNPAKLAISRPGDFLNHAKMLFVFVARPTPPPPVVLPANFHVIPPGIHRESLNPKSGDTYYMAPGAVVFGSLNLWKVSNVKVLGHGVIVYDGPQNPANDDGWMQKPDWHCIGSLEAHHVEIRGITCLVRSRTWSIQMKDSTDFLYDDLRVIGGNPGNANQDGMDWLGGGDTLVRDAFFRASDDVLAMQGNWDGYEHDALVAPGHDIANITVEHSVLSTSISNIVRAGWPEKTYNSHNFTLRDSDILHGGIGSCGPPFALFTYWGAKGAKGTHSNFTFENLWLDDWYSLVQIVQEEADLRGFTFRNIWALGQPPLVASAIHGTVSDLQIENVKFGQASVTGNANLPMDVTPGSPQPMYQDADKSVHASFTFTPANAQAIIQPGTPVAFHADRAASPHAKYIWYFGDGTTATGRNTTHRFPDALGTQLDGSEALGAGRFRVLLQVTEKRSKRRARLQPQGPQDWAEQDIAVLRQLHPAQPESMQGNPQPGLTPSGLIYRIFPGTWPQLPNFSGEASSVDGVALSLSAIDPRGFTRFAVTYDGNILIPTDGGYTFRILGRDGVRLRVDGERLAETGPPFAEVCGSPLNAMRTASGTIGLKAGLHSLQLESLESTSPGPPRLLWQGPGIQLRDVPASAYFHRKEDTVSPKPAPISLVKP